MIKNTLSLKGEDININISGRRMLIFDLLYAEKLINKVELFLQPKLQPYEIEKQIFEWSDGTLIGFYTLKDECEDEIVVKVEEIKEVVELENIELNEVFSTDSGIICLVDTVNIESFLYNVKYDEFVDSLQGDQSLLEGYMNKIKGDQLCFGIISTPGIESGFNFIGSGTYILNNPCF